MGAAPATSPARSTATRLDALAALLHRLVPGAVEHATFGPRGRSCARPSYAVCARQTDDAWRDDARKFRSRRARRGARRIAAKIDRQDRDGSAKSRRSRRLCKARRAGCAHSHPPAWSPGAALARSRPGAQSNITASGRADTSFATKLTASLASTTLAFDGKVAVDLDRASCRRHAAIGRVTNLTSLLRSDGARLSRSHHAPRRQSQGAMSMARPAHSPLPIISGHFAGTEVARPTRL